MKLFRLVTVLVASLLASSIFADQTQALKSCDLKKFSKDPMITKSIKIEKDPSGLAINAPENVNVQQVLQSYATKNQCALYTLSMFSLVKGLVKGSTLPKGASSNQNSSSFKMNDMKNKYILINNVECGNLIGCMNYMNFKLPIKTIK